MMSTTLAPPDSPQTCELVIPLTTVTVAPDAEPTVANVRWQWLLPVGLGVLYGLAAVLLVWIELGQPQWSTEFRGIRFSNTINSSGARHAVGLFRQELGWWPGPTDANSLSPMQYLTGLRVAWLSMFALQFGALLAIRRRPWASPWLWTIGPALASLALMLYPAASTDVNAYASFGWVADMGGNPYVDTPRSIPGDPYARFNDWTHITTPYGPIWTGISHGIVHLTGQDPFWTTICFKLVTVLAAFGLAVVTYHLAKRFTDDPRWTTSAFVFVLWSPILITESAGPVHLEPMMMLFAMAGLLVATGTRFESFRLGLLIAVASILVKPATLPLVGLLALMRFAHSDPIPIVLKRLAVDAIASLALLTAGFAFYWDSRFMEAADRMARDVFIDEPMRSNPLWAWGLAHIDGLFGFSDLVGGDAGLASQILTVLVAVIVTVGVVRALRRQRRMAATSAEEDSSQATLRFMIWAWAVTTMALGILPLNAHAWYVIWTLTPLAILLFTDGRHIRRRPPVWLLTVQLWVVTSFMIYHTLPKR